MSTTAQAPHRIAQPHRDPKKPRPADVLVIFGITGDLAKTNPAHVGSLLDQLKDAPHRAADSVRKVKRLSEETKISVLELLVLAGVIALFFGTGRDHAGLTVFTLSGSNGAPWRDIIVALSVAYVVLVLTVAPLERLADARSATGPELFGKFAYLLVLLFFGFSLIYYYACSKQLWSPHDLSHVSTMFVTMGTIVTAGFAGIEPKSDWIRGLLVLQMIVDIVLVATVGSMALQRYSEGRSPSNLGQSDRAETS
jgi:hypothetical protein